MRLLVAGMIAALIAGPAWGADADQFDLVCKAKTGDDMHYRVDLRSGQYCAGDCRSVQTLEKVTDSEIVFADIRPNIPGDMEAFAKVSRISGDWRSIAIMPRLHVPPVINEGNCTPASFSGFPKRRF